jgi:hypothetical protein
MEKIINTIIENPVAWYGAIVSTVGIIFSGYNIFHNRARVKIKVSGDMQIYGEQSVYDPNKTYSCITVVNKGRRPVRITLVGCKLLYGKKAILFNDSFNSWRNKVLNEENPTTEILIDQNEIDMKNVFYFEVADATGRTYKKYLHKYSPIIKLYYWIIKKDK